VRQRVSVSEQGIEFHFFYAKGSTIELHITARHGTTVDDAIETYFNGISEYDSEHRRFVTMTAMRTLFWNWIEPDRVLYVITCIKAGE